MEQEKLRPLQIVENLEDYLKSVTPEELAQKTVEIQKRIKKMHYRSYLVDKEIKIEQEMNQTHRSRIEKANKELQDPVSISDEIARCKRHELLREIAEEQKNIVELELKVLDLPNLDGNPILE